MSAHRLRGILLLASLAVAGVELLAWSQTWVRVDVDGVTLTASGDVASPALAALALAGLASCAALWLAGPVFRIVLAVLQAALGVCVALAALPALSDPAGSVGGVVSAATGVAGDDSTRALVDDAVLTAWPAVALAAGVAGVVVGVLVVATSRRWPAQTRRYSATRAERVDPTSTIDEWDALSRGTDPTSADATGADATNGDPARTDRGDPPRQ